jgi:hypothetical protein
LLYAVTRKPCEATWHAPLHTQGLETVDSRLATFFRRSNILLGLTNPTMFIRPSKNHHRLLLGRVSPPASQPRLGVPGFPRYERESSDRTSPSASALRLWTPLSKSLGSSLFSLYTAHGKCSRSSSAGCNTIVPTCGGRVPSASRCVLGLIIPVYWPTT